MAVVGQDALDPRQQKAQEEFQRMREQLQHTLERTVGPTPWRVAGAQAAAPVTPVRHPERTRLLHATPVEAISIAGAAFIFGVIATLGVVNLTTPRAPAQVAERPPVEAEPAPPPAVAAAAPAPAPIVTAERETPPAAATAVSRAEPEPRFEEIPAPPVERPAPAPAVVEPEPVEVAAVEETPPPREAPRGVEPEPEPVEAAAPRAVAEEPPISPSAKARVMAAQTLLTGLRYSPGPADGDPGARTIEAAANFASDYGLADANMDAAFLAALRAVDAGTIVRPDPSRNPVVVRVERVREIQTILNALGATLGRPDGDAGPATQAAARKFATEMDLDDANLDAAFLALLREEQALR